MYIRKRKPQAETTKVCLQVLWAAVVSLEKRIEDGLHQQKDNSNKFWQKTDPQCL